MRIDRMWTWCYFEPMKLNTKIAKYADGPDSAIIDLLQEYMLDAIDSGDSDWDEILEAGVDAGIESQKTGTKVTYVALESMVFIFCLTKEKEAKLIKELKKVGSA